MALKRSLLVGLAALLLAAPVADARSPFHRVSKAGSVWADGERYVAYLPPEASPDAATLVVDDITGERWQIHRPQAPDCYRLIGIANGNALWLCSNPGAPVLQELASGVVRGVPGWASFELWLDQTEYGYGSPVGFGDRWIELASGCYHCGEDLQYLDWHSGTFVSGTSEMPERAVDLDRPNYDIPLCAPLRRAVTNLSRPGGSVQLRSSQYEPPWFLRSVFAPGHRVRLYHCGRRKPLVVGRCASPNCSARQLGGGYLTWRDGRRVYSFDLRSRKRRFVGDLPSGSDAFSLTRTSRAIYVSTPIGSPFSAVWAARLSGGKR